MSDHYPCGERRGGKIVAEYPYYDEHNEPYLQVEKTEHKQFLQSHWVKGNLHKKGHWKYGKPAGPKIPFMLPQLIAAPPEELVWICEGEGDAEAAIDLGFTATTNSEGAGKWTEDLNKWFIGKQQVVIAEDNDAAGRHHAAKVARNLVNIVGEVRIVSFPELPEHGDLKDFIAAHGANAKTLLLERAQAAPLFNACVLDPADPMRSARELVAVNFTHVNGLRTLHRHRGAFWEWTGSYYRLADDETIAASIWNFLDKAKKWVWIRRTETWELKPFKPTNARVNDVIAALEAVTQLDKYIEPPAWLASEVPLPAEEFLACGNGLLHLPTGALHAPTPNYFNVAASEVVFDPDADLPLGWLTFLDQLYGNDMEAVELQQEWFGYGLSPETSQQKILLMVGPRRSGKGTIGRILTGLLGRESVAGPTMSSLGEQFGLEPLITKPLAIVSDARIGQRTDRSMIVERLLSISGEDTATVPRKFKQAWTGRLLTRFMILTNELPALTEGSGALAGRLMVLMLTESFFGKEDPALFNKLATELPGILNWALEGYRRLRERGHFVQPASSQEAIYEIEMLGAPVKAFIQDRCNVGPGLQVKVDDLWNEWKVWCTLGGASEGNKAWFGRNLRTAVPGISKSRPRGETGEEERWEVYVGIELKPM